MCSNIKPVAEKYTLSKKKTKRFVKSIYACLYQPASKICFTLFPRQLLMNCTATIIFKYANTTVYGSVQGPITICLKCSLSLWNVPPEQNLEGTV